MPGKAGKEEALNRALPLAIVPAVFAADRAIKSAVLARFSPGETIAVIPGIFHFTRVDNTGAAFGMMRGATGLLVAITLACVCFLVWSIFTSRARSTAAAFALILGGALGNLYDRLVLGRVIDYLDFRVWPVFNFADSAITVGTALLLLGFWAERGKA